MGHSLTGAVELGPGEAACPRAVREISPWPILWRRFWKRVRSKAGSITTAWQLRTPTKDVAEPRVFLFLFTLPILMRSLSWVIKLCISESV